MKLIKSGIPGLDPIMGGGILEGHSVLVCGDPGTGKTIFGLQYLFNGMKEEKENGLYVSVEDNLKKIKYYAKQFGWDMDKSYGGRKVEFLQVPIDRKGFKIIDVIAEKAKELKAKRIVIDSLSALVTNARMFDLPLMDQQDPTGTIKGKILHTAGYTPFEDILQFVYLFVYRISDIGATTLFITDSPPGTKLLSKDEVSEYACDGVIQLKLNDTSRNVSRTIAIKKMRGSDITPGMNSLKFTDEGLIVGEFKAFY